MKIFLIGFMGSGKSTLGFPLAKRLGLPFVDLDHHIEAAQGRTIAEIFAADGQEHFRMLEARYLKEFADSGDDFVMSTGGGTPCFNDNIALMNAVGRTIYLKQDPRMLADRLRNSKTVRPLVAGKTEQELIDYIACTLQEREQYYTQAAIIVANPSRDVSKIVEILQYERE